MNWILPAITAGLGIILIVSVVLCILRERILRKKLANARKQRDELNRENESLHTANKRIVTEQLELHKQNTKLREDLTEAQATIGLLQKSADHATIPIAEVAPAKRTTRKKAGA